MIELNKNQDEKDEKYNELLALIEECDAKDALTKWERDFIDSVFKQLRAKKDLSPKQVSVLERIRDKDYR